MNLKAAKKEALSYIEPKLRFCFTDCRDSMDDFKRYLSRFEALTDDKVKIKDFIEENLLKEYADAWVRVRKECDLSEEDGIFPSVCDLPIPYEKFKHLLK